MVILFKWLSRPLQVSVGLLWATFCFFLFIATGSAFGKPGSSHVEDSQEMSVEAGNSKAKAKPRSWTVHCEREDGTQGIFRVSSNVKDQASPMELESKAEKEEIPQEASTQKVEESSPNPDDADPFGSPSLKCGRLLTLLAIFATAESLAP